MNPFFCKKKGEGGGFEHVFFTTKWKKPILAKNEPIESENHPILTKNEPIPKNT
ncbi:hypothetical protein [Neobacillus jeddahensis]|uniref:hypothetical protein n=1 Tax=Neobacillus jeddahensis TaxID=1461580 RepID=UPI000AADB39A|nr:hypothetical protein [Neobacillus jeddahensis]